MQKRVHSLWPRIDYSNPEDHKKVLERVGSPDFTEDEYVRLLSGGYHNIDSADHASQLFGEDAEEAKARNQSYASWNDDAKKRLEIGAFAEGSLRGSVHNNPDANSKVLAALDAQEQEYRDQEKKAEQTGRGRDFDYIKKDLMSPYHIQRVKEHLLSNGNISKEDLFRHFVDNKHVNHVLSNPGLTQEGFNEMMGKISPSDYNVSHVSDPRFNESHARKILNSKTKIDHLVGKALAKRGLMQPKHAERFLEDHSDQMSKEYADSLLEKLPEDRRKAFLDKKLGIEGGSHHTERPEELESWESKPLSEKQKHWDENVNWQNWEHGPGHDDDGEWASSRFLTEDQIDHVKRHGSFEEKMHLFNNDAVDPKHGAEMWQRWHDDDSSHGYDFDEWKEAFKEENEDSVWENFNEDARLRAEQDYPIEDYISDAYSKGRVYDDSDLEQHILNNPDRFKTVHDNPDFDSKSPEHPENNPRHIDFADQNSGGGHSYNLEDHPDYDDMLDDAENQMRQEKGIPDSVYEGYSEATEDSTHEYAQQAFEDSLDSFHTDWNNLPKHLKGKIPGVVQARRDERLEETKRAIWNHDLEQPYSTDDKKGWARIDHSKLPVTHEYAPGLHHAQMIKDYADANGGKIDLGTLVKRHPGMKDKIKEAFGDKQVVTSDEMQQKIDGMPKTKYGVSMRTWGSNNMQNINGQDQLVVRLDHSPESYMQFSQDPELEETFRKIQDASQRSGHPTNEDSIAWARVDTSNPKHWMIDEVQSDFGSSLRRQVENAEHGDPATKTKLLDHLGKIEAAHADWRENIMNYVINLAKRHGVEQISTHSPESKAAHTGAQNVHTVYKDSYQKVPRQMGFKPVESSELPLTDQGKRIFARNTESKTRFTEQELEGRTPDQHQQKLHHDAMEHHLRQAKIHSQFAKLQSQPSLFDESSEAEAPEGFEAGTPEHHAFMFEQHKKQFSEHKRKAMQHDPTNFYAKNVKFDEYGSKDVSDEDFSAAAGSIKTNAHASHDGDKLLDVSAAGKPHQGHTLDLRTSSLKKSEEESGSFGERIAVRLMEML